MFVLGALPAAGQFTDPGRLDGSGGDVQALVVLGLPVLALGVLAFLYWRTRVEIRRRELEPPLYLLTFISASSHGDVAAPPHAVDQEDLELDRGRRREITALHRRGTRLLVGLGASSVVLWAAAAWYVREAGDASREFEPATALREIERQPPAAPETLTSDLASNLPAVQEPVPAPVNPRPAPPTPRRTRDAAREVSPMPNRSSPPGQGRTPVQDSPPAPSAARLDTAMTPSVVPPKVPAATPDSVRVTPAPPPAPDPATARADAERALDIAARHVVRELGARRPVASSSDGTAAMTRLSDWLRGQRPSVAPGELGDLEVDGPSGEAILPVTLRWRDDFGVGKQRTIRLRIAVQRQTDDWVFTGAELLEKFP